MTQAPVGRLSGNLPLPDRLLAVATRMFAEKGFENTSVQEIVNAAGVTKGAMYHYFGSKDDLLYEIYHRLLGLQMSRLQQIADGPGTAEERLRGAAVDVLNTSFLYLDDFTVFFRSTHLLPATAARPSAPSAAATTSASAPWSRRASGRGRSGPTRPRTSPSTSSSAPSTRSAPGTAPAAASRRPPSASTTSTCSSTD